MPYTTPSPRQVRVCRLPEYAAALPASTGQASHKRPDRPNNWTRENSLLCEPEHEPKEIQKFKLQPHSQGRHNLCNCPDFQPVDVVMLGCSARRLAPC